MIDPAIKGAADAMLALVHEHYIKEAEKVYKLGVVAGIKAERERACHIVRERCPACDNGVIGVHQVGPEPDMVEVEECQYCGEVIAAIRAKETGNV